ncbi:MAG: hypothetical protein LDL25_06230 [Hyphomicrobiales bacterium]|nr:hypothetical protein [Hyphomicrobiales bacterium]
MAADRSLPAGGIALALTLAALLPGGRALAADYLRGSYGGEVAPRAVAPDWAGIYAGAHLGITSGQSDPSNLRSGLVSAANPPSALTNTVTNMLGLREANKQGASYGGFVGVNWQWDEAVLGVEADYTYANIRPGSVTSGSSTVTSGVTFNVSTTTDGQVRLRDWGTLRGRAGYAMGAFMPYLTAGVAFGNIDGRVSLSGSWTSTAPASGTFSSQAGRRGISYGGVIGAGLDMQFLPNTFLRAEWQYLRFEAGSERPQVSINTARVAGGVKF